MYWRSPEEMSSSVSLGLKSDIRAASSRDSSSLEMAVRRFDWYCSLVVWSDSSCFLRLVAVENRLRRFDSDSAISVVLGASRT